MHQWLAETKYPSFLSVKNLELIQGYYVSLECQDQTMCLDVAWFPFQCKMTTGLLVIKVVFA